MKRRACQFRDGQDPESVQKPVSDQDDQVPDVREAAPQERLGALIQLEGKVGCARDDGEDEDDVRVSKENETTADGMDHCKYGQEVESCIY